MSKSQRRRDEVHGILLLDKPVGLTSNGALQQAKHLLAARKAGHTGSLDPIATGLLPLCFGDATKISSFLLGADKRYWVRIRLGETTTTGDTEGEVIESRDVAVSTPQVESALANFCGEIEQIPPMFSALKHHGQPLYKLARQGISVEREPRRVVVYSSELERYSDRELDATVHCSSGFYVRSLAHDLGEYLGCGAHVLGLRRTGVGEFDVADAVTLEALKQRPDAAERRVDLLSGDQGLTHIPAVELSVDAA
ncbi:MAG: tRNA pseudouridine(55) synthase TruB, partial [Gammaproteobacteria bacterium]|nr:tRNA pseudouridine(55) synthase TruB [Gammaproteobacteria bacterium]